MEQDSKLVQLRLKPILNYYTEQEASRLHLCLVSRGKLIPASEIVSDRYKQTGRIVSLASLAGSLSSNDTIPESILQHSQQQNFKHQIDLLKTMEMFQQSLLAYEGSNPPTAKLPQTGIQVPKPIRKRIRKN